MRRRVICRMAWERDELALAEVWPDVLEGRGWGGRERETDGERERKRDLRSVLETNVKTIGRNGIEQNMQFFIQTFLVTKYGPQFGPFLSHGYPEILLLASSG